MARAREDAAPWYHRVLELIADGEWHDVSDIVSLVAPMIPPGIGWRASETERMRRNGTDAPRKQGNDMTSIQVGQRRLAMKTIQTLRRTSRAEVEYVNGAKPPGVRMVPNKIRLNPHPTRKERGTRPTLENVEHGTNATYTRGCGCRPCTEAHNVYHRAYKRKRRADK